MAETVIISYQLTADLWRRFLSIHYGRDRHLRGRMIWGAICMAIGAMGFGGIYEKPAIAILLTATGFFGVLSRPLLLARSLRAAAKHPFFGEEITVAVSSVEIAVRSGTSGYRQPWSNFAGYLRTDAGFILYHDKQAFFFIPAEALTSGYANRIAAILDEAKIPRR